jgi:hypothetical protein
MANEQATKQENEQATDQKDEQASEQKDEQASEQGDEEQKTIPKPEITDEHREKAKDMAKAYEDDRPTIALPGTGHTVTGQAVADWLEDDGSPKYGDVDEDGGIKREDVAGTREKTMNESERPLDSESEKSDDSESEKSDDSKSEKSDDSK